MDLVVTVFIKFNWAESILSKFIVVRINIIIKVKCKKRAFCAQRLQLMFLPLHWGITSQMTAYQHQNILTELIFVKEESRVSCAESMITPLSFSVLTGTYKGLMTTNAFFFLIYMLGAISLWASIFFQIISISLTTPILMRSSKCREGKLSKSDQSSAETV